MKRIRHIGVLTSGGDAPGLNAVVRSVVKTTVMTHGLKVTGIRDGFEGLLERNGFVPLTCASVRGILPRGGTILGTRNSGRYSAFFDPKATATAKRKLLRDGISALKRHKIDALIAIGGEGSLMVAQTFFEAGFPVVGVPKTIDNDLSSTDYTFGFDTAVQTATEALDRLTTTAESHNRVMILEVMGRDAGWIAYAAGLAGGADIILIPEIPFHLGRIAEHIRLRESTGATFHLIVASEGAAPRGGKAVYQSTPEGHRKLGGIAAQLTEQLGRILPREVRFTVLGHLQRGGTPSSFDRILGTRFGAAAVDLVVHGRFGRMVCLRGRRLDSVPIKEAIRVYKRIDPKGQEIAQARAIGLSFGD